MPRQPWLDGSQSSGVGAASSFGNHIARIAGCWVFTVDPPGVLDFQVGFSKPTVAVSALAKPFLCTMACVGRCGVEHPELGRIRIRSCWRWLCPSCQRVKNLLRYQIEKQARIAWHQDLSLQDHDDLLVAFRKVVEEGRLLTSDVIAILRAFQAAKCADVADGEGPERIGGEAPALPVASGSSTESAPGSSPSCSPAAGAPGAPDNDPPLDSVEDRNNRRMDLVDVYVIKVFRLKKPQSAPY